MKKPVKHLILGVMLVSIFGLTSFKVSTAAATSMFEVRMAQRAERIQAKLAIIQEKAGVEVKNKVAEKIKIKEEKIAAAKKAAAEKKAAAAKKAEAAKQAAQPATPQTAPVVNNDQAVEATTAATDVTTSASQRGREIGETNRAYGQQLSDPNLTQSERQAIIQEKKNYNRSRR